MPAAPAPAATPLERSGSSGEASSALSLAARARRISGSSGGQQVWPCLEVAVARISSSSGSLRVGVSQARGSEALGCSLAQQEASEPLLLDSQLAVGAPGEEGV